MKKFFTFYNVAIAIFLIGAVLWLVILNVMARTIDEAAPIAGSPDMIGQKHDANITVK